MPDNWSSLSTLKMGFGIIIFFRELYTSFQTLKRKRKLRRKSFNEKNHTICQFANLILNAWTEDMRLITLFSYVALSLRHLLIKVLAYWYGGRGRGAGRILQHKGEIHLQRLYIFSCFFWLTYFSCLNMPFGALNTKPWFCANRFV